MVFPGISGAPLLIKPTSGVEVQDVFNTSLWTGNGAARTITTGIDNGEGSLVWIKARSLSVSHALFDTFRGPNQLLQTNTTSGSQSVVSGWLDSFTSTGYVLGSNPGVNQSTQTFVGWQFRRAPKFFDIVQYTGNGVVGRSISHGLGVKPGMMIVKRTNADTNWPIYQQSRAATQAALFNNTGAFDSSGSVFWNNSEPSDSAFTLGNNVAVNASGGTYIAYLFAHDPSPVGIIQCGSYVGDGSTSGPVINLGWRPQYLMVKNATATGDWQIIDASRGFTSANDAILLPNTSGAETSENLVNPNSTGFQLASTASNVNSSGQTYIYMAIREA